MKIHEFFEAQQNKLILIDFQPEYSKAYKYSTIFNRVCNYINSNDVEVLAFYNGDGYSDDNKSDVQNHYFEYGVEDLSKIQFVEKTYAFLRSWMDIGVDKTDIIKTLRYMMLHHINDSQQIEDEDLETLVNGFDINTLKSDSIYFTNLPIAKLKTFSNALMGGGARHECFEEMRILMSAFNIKGKEVRDWIY